MPKISVIVPIYNTGKYLSKCLYTLINQTFKDIEIIIINDCSTDNSKKILESYKKYKNIKIFHNDINKGIGYTRNIGLDNAKGEYISFIDSDDFVDLTMYEKMYKKALKDNLDMVVCRFHKLLEKDDGSFEELDPKYGIPYFENTSLKYNPNLLLQINLAPWNKLYKKSLFTNDVRFPEDLKYEDAIVVVKAMARSKKIGMLEDKLNYYLVRNNSESTVMDERVFDIITINQYIYEELKRQNYYEEIKHYVEEKIVQSISYYIKQQQYQKNKTIANSFITKALTYLNTNFPNWKKIDYSIANETFSEK